ncbi:glycogen debranching protein, partial [bacterium]|nr:glycogen debranching protein [bacterium]
MRFSYLLLLVFFFLTCNNSGNAVFKNEHFTIYPDRVEQGRFSARVFSSGHLISDYQSDYLQPTKRDVYFKFSINGRDNERAPGEDHHFILPLNGKKAITPVYQFGRTNSTELTQMAAGESPFLDTDASVTIRIDMRPVMQQLTAIDKFTTATGETIQKSEFDGVFIAGSVLPLTWEFTALPQQEKFRLTDDDNDGIFEVTLIFPKYQRGPKSKGPLTWELSANVSHYPQYTSPLPLTGALYNIALEELVQNIRPDGALMAGAKWPGVWTRDISYSIILSLAMIEPDAARSSLLAKVKQNRIVQDTGTGGSWPISSDRVVWALAAWEVYLATGDIDWLDYSFHVIQNTLEMDLKTVFNPETGLMFGESSFLDWREQTYPRWMDPKDIYQSQCLSTNALYFQAFQILIKMGQLLDEDVSAYLERPEKLKSAINRYLWQSEKGYYGQYLYGRTFYTLSSRAETLGEALCILSGIADVEQRQKIVARMPLTDWGP